MVGEGEGAKGRKLGDEGRRKGESDARGMGKGNGARRGKGEGIWGWEPEKGE